MLLLSITLLSMPAAAQAREASPERTATCRRIGAAVARGVSHDELEQLLQGARNITRRDLDCLRSDGVDPEVQQLVRQERARRRGVERPDPDIEVDVVLPDLRTIAVQQKGALMVALGDLAAGASITKPVDQHVVDEILREARLAFREEEVQARVTLKARELPTSRATYWDRGRPRAVELREGTYYVLRVRIADALAAARAQAPALFVDLAVRAGMDVEGVVDRTVREMVWSRLAENGIQSWVVDAGDSKGASPSPTHQQGVD